MGAAWLTSSPERSRGLFVVGMDHATMGSYVVGRSQKTSEAALSCGERRLRSKNRWGEDPLEDAHRRSQLVTRLMGTGLTKKGIVVALQSRSERSDQPGGSAKLMSLRLCCTWGLHRLAGLHVPRASTGQQLYEPQGQASKELPAALMI